MRPSQSSDPGRQARFGRTTPERIGLLLGGLLLAALGFVPQFGGPGYEAALAAGVLLPSIAAVTTARVVLRQKLGSCAAAERGALFGLALALVGLTVTLLHGVRVGSCDFWEGVALFALGPAPGSVLGGVSGAFAGFVANHFVRRVSRRGLAGVLLAFAGPVVCVAVSLIRFYTSPMVFAYDPYAGYFSGPLYDTVIGSLVPLGTYRLGTLATLIALLALAVLLEEPRDHKFWSILRARPRVGAVGLAALSVSLTLIGYGPELGHFSTSKSIQQALGRSVSVGPCGVVYSNGILQSDARRLARECTAHLLQLERFFATKGSGPVLVYLFSSEFEKARLMGAGRTSMAKPWRREVYLQAAGYPHPVLGHELAHVVAGRFGRGPFRVAGLLAGWLPDPGRIEGVATAAAPDENDALTLEQWAAAMHRLELLPDLRSLFRLGFFGHNAAQAYTAAGAFVRFLRAERGPLAVQRWYGGDRLEEVTGTDLEGLEQRWHAALGRVPLSDAALATARARFERPAFFERRCPRVIDRILSEAGARLAASDLDGARKFFEQVQKLDPGDSSARLGLAACSARAGHDAEALAEYAALSTAQSAAPWAQLAAREARADLLLRTGKISEARRAYTELAKDLVDEDRLRTLDVKKAAGNGALGEAIVMLLIGDALGPSWDVAAPLLGESAALATDQGLADYLIGRNLLGRGRLVDAARHFERALKRGLTEPRVLEEALRLRVVVACALEDSNAAGPALARFLALPLRESRRAGMLRFAERCGL